MSSTSSRRPAPRRAGVSLALAAALVLALAAGCGEAPTDDLAVARRSMQRAAEAGGAERAPEACGAAHAALARAEAEAAVQSRRPKPARNFKDAAELAGQARRAAEACALRAAASLNRARREADRGLADLETSIASARTLARHLPPHHPARAGLARAAIALSEGRAGAERGQQERAIEAVERGRSEVRALIATIDRHFEAVRRDPRAGRWAAWIRDTIRESRRSDRPAILVDKLRRQLLLVRGRDEIASYPVELGISGVQSKVFEGDEATPEGRYRVTEVRGPGQTRYYRALMLDYPNEEDLENLRRLRRSGSVPRDLRAGGLIEIHGMGGRGVDWTQGCVALVNEDMDDLVGRVGVDTPVTIVGTIPEDAL